MITFNYIDENKYLVEVDEKEFGTLQFDDERKIWVLWALIADGNYSDVDYFESLEETKETIIDEIQTQEI